MAECIVGWVACEGPGMKIKQRWTQNLIETSLGMSGRRRADTFFKQSRREVGREMRENRGMEERQRRKAVEKNKWKETREKFRGGWERLSKSTQGWDAKNSVPSSFPKTNDPEWKI